MIKPIFAEEINDQILDAVSQYRNRDKWREWGMHTVREQGACILLEGPPGCGKTTAARYMGKLIKRGFKILNVAQIGGGEPGATEKNIQAFFEDARSRNSMTIFLDECDHILRRRSDVTGDGLTWLVGTCEEIITQVNTYKGLVIMATNLVEVLEPALADRFMSIVHIGRPSHEQRVMLWKQKTPAQFPLKFTNLDIERLAAFDLSGRQIEMVIVNVASNAIRKGRKPTMAMFDKFCAKEEGKHLVA